MNHDRSRSSRLPAFALTVLASALLAACGGGGSDDGDASAGSLDDATATTYSANATEMASDATSVADTGILAAQAVVATGAGAMKSEGDGAEKGEVQPLAASTQACPGGGSVTVSITGGTLASQLNHQFDTGEVYQVSYAACAGAGGLGRLDGSLAITVVSATGDSVDGALSLATTATDLTLTTARGSASLNGSTQRDFSVATDGDGSVHLTSRFVAPSVTLATHYNARSSTFTLSATDIRRTATLVGGVLQSSTIDGMHTLAATLPNASFTFSVATAGSASYGADGLPTAGNWTVTLPNNLVKTTVANALATIEIDHGKDGTIDRTFTIPVAQLARSAG